MHDWNTLQRESPSLLSSKITPAMRRKAHFVRDAIDAALLPHGNIIPKTNAKEFDGQ